MQVNNDTVNLPDIDDLWNFRNPRESEERFKNLIPAAEMQADKSYLVVLLTQLARTQGIQFKFREAHSFLDLARKNSRPAMIIPLIRYHLERGRAYNTAGRKKLASRQFLLAFNLAVENKADFYAIDAAHMLGVSEAADKQITWSLAAIDLAEKSEDEKSRSWLGPLYNNTGWSFHDLRQFDRALEFFNKSLLWRQQKNDKRGEFLALYAIGRAYRSLKKIDEALKIHLGLLSEMEEGRFEHDGFVYEEIAECMLENGEKENAKDYFKRAYELFSQDKWLIINEPKRLERLKVLSV